MASRFFRVVVESFESEAAGMKTVVSAGDAAAGRAAALTAGISGGTGIDPCCGPVPEATEAGLVFSRRSPVTAGAGAGALSGSVSAVWIDEDAGLALS